MSEGLAHGLEGVIAAHTVLSDVDGAHGRLVIRGYAVEDLAGHTTFEQAAHLLFDGFFDEAPADLAPALGAARVKVFAEVGALDEALAKRDPVEAMRAGAGPPARRAAPGHRPAAAGRPGRLHPGRAARRRRPGAGRARSGPVARRRHPADDARPARQRRRDQQALDAYLVTVCDHGLNASTFAARVIASTRAGLTSAVLGGISALKGPLHGGAPGPVIDMLDSIGTPENASPWLEKALARGDRLMGFGHRIYRVRDPRADALKAAVRKLSGASRTLPGRVAFAEAVEAGGPGHPQRDRKPDRPLDTNVEFYTALLLEALGLPPSSFTCVFAMGRTAGWIAHAREQLAGGKLIRPQSVYVGPGVRQAA